MLTQTDTQLLTAEELRIFALVHAEEDGWTSHCFQSALTHLSYAQLISEVDPAMAMFRAITAEEEAATGLLHALKFRNYPASDALLVRDHVHKAAVLPFLLSILKHLSHLRIEGIETIKLAISTNEEKNRLLTVLVLNGENEGRTARPNPPLNLRILEGSEKASPKYDRYFREIIGPHGFQEIRNYLKDKANERNLILYSSHAGLKRIENLPKGYLEDRKNRVLTIIKSALLFWPYPEIQPFVSDAIPAFLTIVGQIKKGKKHF